MYADPLQLPGSMASERATGLTSHLDAMGCRKSARVMLASLIYLKTTDCSADLSQFMASICQLCLFHRLDRSRCHLATSDIQRDQCRALYRSICRHWTKSGELDTSRLRAIRLGTYPGRYHLYVLSFALN